MARGELTLVCEYFHKIRINFCLLLLQTHISAIQSIYYDTLALNLNYNNQSNIICECGLGFEEYTFQKT